MYRQLLPLDERIPDRRHVKPEFDRIGRLQPGAIHGELTQNGRYPSRAELAHSLGLASTAVAVKSAPRRGPHALHADAPRFLFFAGAN